MSDASYIKISGECFKNDSVFTILQNRINIVFGRNGSGKSTIARALDAKNKSNNDNKLSCQIYSSTGEPKNINTYVFNEQFIDKELKIEESGIHSVIMFGEQIDIENNINRLKDNFKNIEEEKLKAEIERDKIDNERTRLNNEIRFNMQNGWAERQKGIKSNSSKSPVTQSVINKIHSLNSTITNDNEYHDALRYLEKQTNLLSNSKNANKIPLCKPLIPLDVNLNQLFELLEAKIENPTLNERDHKILDIIQGEFGIYINKAKTVFAKSEICPLCLRGISSSEKKTLYVTISKVLGEEVEKEKTKLNKIRQQIFSYSSSLNLNIVDNLCESLFPALYKKVDSNMRLLKAELGKLDNIIDKKIQTPYQPSFIHKRLNINILFESLASSYKAINDEIEAHNTIIDNREKKLNELSDLNFNIALYELNNLSNEFKLTNKKYNEIKDSIDKLAQKQQELSKSISLEESRSQNIHVAEKLINKYLSFIFCDNNRLKIEAKDGMYILKIRGNNVKPNKLSIGERNILALVYFLAKFSENKKESELFAEESLVVFDDPVSSFDYENRIGVMSFLYYFFHSIIQGNENSKILFLTHDLQVLFDTCKISEEILGYSPARTKEPKKNVWQLKNMKCESFDFKKKNEYKVLLNDAYNFAINGINASESEQSAIGNKLRKILETLSTFLYSKSVTQMLSDEKILASIPESRRNTYKYRLHRLILHGGSHKEDSIYASNPFEMVASVDELQYTAKLIIMFLYETNMLHLSSYLDGDNKNNEKIKNIDSWINVLNNENTLSL